MKRTIGGTLSVVTAKQLQEALGQFPEGSIINIFDGDTKNVVVVYEKIAVKHRQLGLMPIGCIVIEWSSDDPIKVQIY